jgi:hypothetical protein
MVISIVFYIFSQVYEKERENEDAMNKVLGSKEILSSLSKLYFQKKFNAGYVFHREWCCF